MQVTSVVKQEKPATVKLTDQPLRIGRDPKCGIVLDDAKTSRNHCTITPWDGEFLIKDLHSQNGTCVNGQRVEESVLRNGDQIMCGDTVLTVEAPKAKGTNTVIRQIATEMRDQNKGSKTMLRELVRKAGSQQAQIVARQ